VEVMKMAGEVNAPIVLAERPAAGGVVWRARVTSDRSRLEVVAIVPASTTPVVVERLSDSDLKELLAQAPGPLSERWTCRECGAENPPDRRWCRACSGHQAV
jgi:ribosomal protein L40E